MAEEDNDHPNIKLRPWPFRWSLELLFIATVLLVGLRVWMTIYYSPLNDDLSSLGHTLDKFAASTLGAFVGLAVGKKAA